MAEFNTKLIDALAAAEEKTCGECSFYRAMVCPDDDFETKSPTEEACICFEGVKA